MNNTKPNKPNKTKTPPKKKTPTRHARHTIGHGRFFSRLLHDATILVYQDRTAETHRLQETRGFSGTWRNNGFWEGHIS